MTYTPSLEHIELFTSGEDGYHTYRIPALLITKEGTVLAFCEARKNSASDHGDIDLALKRSIDRGRTWSDMRIIADDGDHTMGNPCPVLDERSGTIWVPLCRDNKRVLIMKSTDDGRTWSEPVDITSDTMDPAWYWVGTGPGHGIQTRTGRLVIPSWADATERLGEIQFSFAMYSDDGGAIWERGSALDPDTSDECEAVELVDGSLHMNMRSRQRKRQRAFAWSEDEGQSWSPVEFDPRQPEPSCQGSIIRLTRTPTFRKNRILLACPANPAARDHLTVRVSYDECRTWPVSKGLCAGSSAYSDLAVTGDGRIFCLYEAEDYRKILLAKFSIEWLTDGEDHLESEASNTNSHLAK